MGDMAAAEAEAAWAETEAIVSDVERLCAESDAPAARKRCVDLVRGLTSSLAEYDAPAQKLVESAEQQRDVARERADDLAARMPSSPEIEALENERAALENRLREQSVAKEDALKQVAELEAQLSEMEAKLKEAKTKIRGKVPVMNHTLSLFANVTHIKWDFDKSDARNVVGTVVDAATGRVKDFSIDSQACSEFELANRLWQEVGPV